MNPNPSSSSEVAAKATRRKFSAVEKARILDAYEAASAVERASIIRRENIYSSHIAAWRKQRAAGVPLEAKRGRKADPEGIEMTKLRKENESLRKRLARAELINDAQGKVYALLRAIAGEGADQMDLPPWQKR